MDHRDAEMGVASGNHGRDVAKVLLHTRTMLARQPHLGILRGPTSANLLLGFAEDLGLSAAQVVADSGVNLNALTDLDLGIRPVDEIALVRTVLASGVQRPGLGLSLGARYHLTVYGICGLALMSSPTLDAAMRLANRFFDLTYALTRMEGSRTRHTYTWLIDESILPLEVQSFLAERDLMAALTCVRELVGADTALRQVRLRQPKPDDLRFFESLDVGDVTFGAGDNALVFDVAVLDAPLPHANADTAAMCVAQCADLLQRRRSRVGVAGNVRTLLLGNLVRFSDMKAVAYEMNMDERTLRRRLNAEGASFRTLVDEVREALAEEYLCVGGLTVEQTSSRLGYTEPTSFTHAFHRWKGMSPREFRRHQEQRTPSGVRISQGSDRGAQGEGGQPSVASRTWSQAEWVGTGRQEPAGAMRHGTAATAP